MIRRHKTRFLMTALPIVVVGASVSLLAQAPADGIVRLDPALDKIVPKGAKVEKVVDGAPRNPWFRGTASRFTFNSQSNSYPVRSPDGSRIAFSSSRDGGSGLNVYQRATSGSVLEEALDKDPRNKSVDWSRDGRYIIEVVVEPKTQRDIWVLPILEAQEVDLALKLSPVTWLARIEVVATFPIHPGHAVAGQIECETMTSDC